MVNDLFSTAVLLSLLTYIGYSMREVPETIITFVKRKIIFRVTVYQYDEFYDILQQWLSTNNERGFSDVSVKIKEDYKGKRTTELVHHSDSFVLRRHGKKILIRKENREITKKDTDSLQFYMGVYEITGVFAKVVIEQMVQEILEWGDKKNTSGIVKVYSDSYDSYWKLLNQLSPKGLDKLYIDGVTELRKDLIKFTQDEKWYIEMGIPYKRGYLFHGAPGNGKTALIQAVAKELNRNICTLSLKSIHSDSELINTVAQVPFNSILVMEDVDTSGDMVKERKTKTKDGDSKVSLSAVLNCLDGVYYKHGLIVIATTNHVEVLDEAFLRVGRFDYKMEITNPSKKNVEDYISNFFQKQLQLFDYADGSYSMVQIQDMCLTGEIFTKLKTNINISIN